MKEIKDVVELEPLKDTEWIVMIARHAGMDSGWAADSLLFKTLDDANEYATGIMQRRPEDVRFFKVDFAHGA